MVMGERGNGKSTVMNFLIQQFQNAEFCTEIFPPGNGSKSHTKGIKYYFPQKINEQKEEILVLFDCEGFDYSSDSAQEENLKKLICLISRLSTCLFYVHSNPRIGEGFQKIIDLLKLGEEDFTHNNFIEIFNMWNGIDNVEVYKQVYPFINKTYKLRSFQFVGKNTIENNIYFQQFIEEIKIISNDCKRAKYVSTQKSCESFNKNQTCKSFKEILISSFQIIENNMNTVSIKIFVEVIDTQLKLKIQHSERMVDMRKNLQKDFKERFQEINSHVGNSYLSESIYELFNISFQNYQLKEIKKKFDNSYQKWKKNFEEAFDNMLEQGTNLGHEQRTKIINQYLNLDSIKPDDIRQYEKYKNTIKSDFEVTSRRFFYSLAFVASSGGVLVIAEGMVTAGLIAMVGLGTICLSGGLLGLGLGCLYKIFRYSKQSLTIQSKSKNLKQALFQSINNKEIIKNQNQQNMIKVIQILKSEITGLEEKINSNLNLEEIYPVCFLMLINLISKPFDEKQLDNLKNNNTNNPYLKDLKVLEIAVQQAKQLEENQPIDLIKINSLNEIKIEDKDISIYDSIDGIEFKNYNLKRQYENQFMDQQQNELYKCLFVLKNRNENMLVNFVLYTYFGEYIQSEEFAKLVMEQNLIQKTLNFQNKIFN
ncbi:hypothetical protein ABPG74_000990 [Tetrahymena malaccensis]